MRYSWQIVRKLQEKDELNEEEMTDLIDYLNILKEELKKLRIILYMDYLVEYVKRYDEGWTL